MDFRPLDPGERQALFDALRRNVGPTSYDGKALLMGADTTFAGTADEVTDEEVINAIKSVPCHY